MNKYSSKLKLVNDAPADKMDPIIKPRIKALMDSPIVTSDDLLDIIDDCVEGGLTSQLVTLLMSNLHESMMADEGVTMEQARKVRNFRRDNKLQSSQVFRIPETIRLYYMRDDHTFRTLSGSFEEMHSQVMWEFDLGWTGGMLCTKTIKDFNDVVHAHGFRNRSDFMRAAQYWILSAYNHILYLEANHG